MEDIELTFPQLLQCWIKRFSVMDGNSRQKILLRYGLLFLALLIVGRQWYWVVFPTFFAIWASSTPYFQRCKRTLRRDLTGLRVLLTVKWDIKQRFRKDLPIHHIWLERVASHPDKEAAVEIETGRRMSYHQVNGLMNQYAAYYSSLSYKKDDVVALFMENCIDFYALWMGLSKIGVVSAFINSNLKLDPLAHSIRVSKCRSVITTPTLLPMLRKAMAEGLIPADTKIFLSHGSAEEKGVTILESAIDGASTSEPPPCPDLNFQSVLCYIYTSGTTGNPKPAVIKHFRYYWMAMGAATAFGITTDDRVYITMPIYHSAAGILGIGSTIVRGSTIVIRKKFSASNFWKDAIAHGCTCSQYIGELCRYLLAQPSTPEEKQHKIRMMWGNGLRPEIWTEFTTRFGLTRIGELYGSTEGNSNLLNLDNHVGSCGFFPIYPYLTALYPVRLVRVDEETGEILRDKNGLAILCRPGETGEMIGLIRKASFDALLRFEGYVNKEDTAKKIYRDVMCKGDQVFASGDILHWDEYGYLFFKDRRGDTFRWKGENVSTTEVEGILQPVKSVVDCTVYGVEIGKQEGRAGMAALHLAPGVDVDELLVEAADRFTSNLASYAIPVFIRICREVDKTGTYKLKKTDMQKASFDLEKCAGDNVYLWSGGKYTQLTAELQKQIDSGEYTRI